MPVSNVPPRRPFAVDLHHPLHVERLDRGAVRAAHERRQDLLGTSRQLRRRCSSGWHVKILRRLGVSPGPLALNGPVIVKVCMCGRPAQSKLSIELRRNGCRRTGSATGAILDKRHRDVVRTRGHGHAHAQPRVHRVARVGRLVEQRRRDPRVRRSSRGRRACRRSRPPPRAGTRGRARCRGWCDRASPETRSRASSGNVYRTAVPPIVPSGSPSMCVSCDRSWRMRNVSLPAAISGLPTATAAIFMAADTYFSCSDGETPSTSEMLSKPYAASSGGRSEVTSTSRSSRSRIAFAYSARFRRCRIGAPGLGCAAASASSAASSADCTARYVASSGRREPCGGIVRASSLRTTFSQTSGFDPARAASSPSSDSPPVFRRWL